MDALKLEKERQSLERRLDSIERVVLRVIFSLSLIVTVVTLLTAEFAQAMRILQTIMGSR